MKSTKIEDIIDTDDLLEDNTEVETQVDDQVNNELKIQLDDLKSELSNIQQKANVVTHPEPEQSTPPVNTRVTKTQSFVEKLISFDNIDVSNGLLIIALFIIMNSSYVNELIDLYTPYSIYKYGYVVKAIVYFAIYRIITSILMDK